MRITASDHAARASPVRVAWGDYPRAASLFEDALAIDRARGDEQRLAEDLGGLCAAVLNLGELAGARALIEESLTVARRCSVRWSTAMSLMSLGHVEVASSNHGAARDLFAEAAVLYDDIGNALYLPWCLEGLAAIAAAFGHHATATELEGRGTRSRRRRRRPSRPSARPATRRHSKRCAPRWETTSSKQRGAPAGIDRPKRLSPSRSLRPSARTTSAHPERADHQRRRDESRLRLVLVPVGHVRPVVLCEESCRLLLLAAPAVNAAASFLGALGSGSAPIVRAIPPSEDRVTPSLPQQGQRTVVA